MLRVWIVLVCVASVARADPPVGYRCGFGKANPGKGCTCPEKYKDVRDDKNVAICAAAAAPTVGGATGSAAPPASPCKRVATKIHQRMKQADPKQIGDIPTAQRPKFLREASAAIEKRCVADKWSTDVTKCFVVAPDERAVEACAKSLTTAQQDGIENTMDTLVKKYRAMAEPKDEAKSEVPKTEEPKPHGEGTRAVVRGDKIEIRDRVNFVTAKAAINPISFALLDDVAAVLKDHPSIKIRVEGHTDDVSSSEANLRLSAARAEAVREYLIKRGIAGDRMEAKGFGETRPIASNRTEAGRAANRRIEFVVIAQ